MSKTVTKALGALEYVRAEPLPLGVLAERIGVHPSVALRMLAPMVEAGLLARGKDGRYRLGLNLIGLGQDVLECLHLPDLAHDHLVTLAAETGCTVHLAQLVDEEIVYVDKVDTPAAVRMWSRIGRPVPLHTAAASKAVLAVLNTTTRERLLKRCEFTVYTDHTIPTPDALREHLDEVRTRGWATDSAEFESLVHCVGVPLRTPSGLAPAAVSAAAVREPPTRDEVATLARRLRAVAAGIEHDLGLPPPADETSARH